MKRITIFAVVLFAFSQLAFGQNKRVESKPEVNEALEARKEIMQELKFRGTQAPEAAGPTAGDVGDVDSFDKNAKFMGIAGSGTIYVYSSCDPAVLLADLELTLGPDDRCLAAPDPGIAVNATFTDIARINIPGKTAANVIYAIANHSIAWDFMNPTAGTFRTQMSYSPRMTIISEALNDPAAIDPNTGLPMNGSYTTTGFGTKFANPLLGAGQTENFTESYTRANTSGFSRSFWTGLGLPNNVINKLFNKPMTIRLDARVAVRGVTFGQYVYTARFLGN
jgi:hypothetical protein